MVMTTSVYVCLKYVVIPFVNPSELIFNNGLITSVFLSEWKKGNIVPCYKKGDKASKITAQVLYFPSAEIFLNDSYLKECLNQHLISLVLNQVTLALISFYQLLMKFIYLLIMNLKLDMFSWIYLKSSIKFGMKGLNLNLSKTVFRMTC